MNPLAPKVRKIVKKEKKRVRKRNQPYNIAIFSNVKSFLIFIAVKKKENF